MDNNPKIPEGPNILKDLYNHNNLNPFPNIPNNPDVSNNPKNLIKPKKVDNPVKNTNLHKL